MTAPSMGYAQQLGMAASAPATEAYEFKSADLASDRTIYELAGMRGSRSRVIERLRKSTIAPSGPIVLEPTPEELRKLMPRILGGAEGGSAGAYTYALAETLPTFVTVIDRVAKVFTYTGCYVDKATFRSSAAGPLELTLDVEALSESVGNAGTFPSLTINNTAPFMHFDGVLTLASSSIQMMDVELVIDNQLKKDRWVNSQTRTDLPAMDRIVSLNCTVPYTSDTTALYDGAITGVTASLVYTNGSTSVTFTLANVVFPAKRSPTSGSKDEVTLRLEGMVRKTSSTNEVAVTVDNT